MPFQTENGKRKPRRVSLIRFNVCTCANGSLPFVYLLTKKSGVIPLQTNKTEKTD